MSGKVMSEKEDHNVVNPKFDVGADEYSEEDGWYRAWWD